MGALWWCEEVGALWWCEEVGVLWWCEGWVFCGGVRGGCSVVV